MRLAMVEAVVNGRNFKQFSCSIAKIKHYVKVVGDERNVRLWANQVWLKRLL